MNTYFTQHRPKMLHGNIKGCYLDMFFKQAIPQVACVQMHVCIVTCCLHETSCNMQHEEQRTVSTDQGALPSGFQLECRLSKTKLNHGGNVVQMP